uniref:DNA polymerase III subunit gamma/tau n=1 Tax=Anthurium amnicola TaxID=1678845 RepID=A0A1D1YW96_9ARAE
MAEAFVCPSELHLKKELSALRKARFLRDPETCSSWRSPLASGSVAACSTLSCGDENEGYPAANDSGGLLEVEPNSNLPLRNGNSTKRVYLYNWGHHSSKSSHSGVKLDEDKKQGSGPGSPEDSPIDPQKADSKSDTLLDEPVPDFSVKRTRPETPTRRNARKLRRAAVAKYRNHRNSAMPKLPDLSSGTFGAFNSTEQSDDTEYCNSGDLRRSTLELIRKTGYASSSTSPLLSGSGCGNWSCSSRILRNARKEESSYSVTPASTSSYNRYGHQRPSTMGSWDGTTASFDVDEVKEMELSRRQGCGIPCYSSKRVKDRGCGGWYSPSFSDTLKRKGSSILCGSQTRTQKRRASGVRKRRFLPKTSKGLPQLTNGRDEDRSLVDAASDELSTNFGELDLEALSRLDGRRWSNCGSQEGLGVQLPSAEGESSSHRSLSQKYRPKSFDEIIGQNMVVQSLHNAILRGRIAPAYLFYGPRGTGKTSTARIFAAALNCLATGENKPCGFCRECTEFASGNGSNVREVDATNKKGIDSIRSMLKNLHKLTASSRYRVFIIDECHILSSKVWSAFIKFVEEPPMHIVFVFITIDPDNLPRAILSRCQKYLFPKIKEVDINGRLRRLSAEEGIDVELDALELVVLNSDGSLRDAETMLNQLGLLRRRITTSLVHDLVGVVSDERLFDLLETAMSSNTAETVKRSRELMDSGVDPIALMSQLAGLIMDIIAGTYRLTSSKPSGSVLCGRSLTDPEMDRLQQALRILSDAEKQLRLSSERSTWFTAALLQLGSGHSSELNHSSGSSSQHSSRKAKSGTSDWVKGTAACRKSDSLPKTTQSRSACTPSAMKMDHSPCVNPSSSLPMGEKNSDSLPMCNSIDSSFIMPATCKDEADSECFLTKISLEKLNDVWQRCIDKCHSKTLRKLLSAHGQLTSISEVEGVLVVSIAFDEHIKTRAVGYLRSITNSMEVVLGHRIKVRIGSAPDNFMGKTPCFRESTGEQTKTRLLDKEKWLTDDSNSSVNDSHEECIYLPRKSTDNSGGKLQRTLDISESSQVPNANAQGTGSLLFSSKENGKLCGTLEKAVRRIQPSPSNEQRLESAWLQAVEKGTTGLVRPEKNQILPQNGMNNQHQNVSKLALAISSKHWEDELNNEIKALKISDTHSHHKEHFGVRVGAISPSLLHRTSFAASFDKDNLEYESGPGCNGLLCWKTGRRYKGKVKQRTRSERAGRLLPFGPCGKSKAKESNFGR